MKYRLITTAEDGIECITTEHPNSAELLLALSKALLDNEVFELTVVKGVEDEHSRQ